MADLPNHNRATDKNPGHLRRKVNEVTETTRELVMPRRSRQLLASAAARLKIRGNGKFNPPTYEDLLDGWGIEPGQVAIVQQNIRREVRLLSVLVAIGLIVTLVGIIQRHGVMLLGGLVTMALPAVHIAIGVWRLEVLRTRQFTPFLSWLRGKKPRGPHVD